MKALLAAFTFTLVTLSQSAFAMYYACKDTNDAVVACSPNSTAIEISNDPFYANYSGYLKGSLRVSVTKDAIVVVIVSDQTGLKGIPIMMAGCALKTTSPMYPVAQLLAASNIPTYDLTNRTGMISVKFKTTAIFGGECTSLEYSKSGR